jgi:hypothetical protein
MKPEPEGHMQFVMMLLEGVTALLLVAQLIQFSNFQAMPFEMILEKKLDTEFFRTFVGIIVASPMIAGAALGIAVMRGQWMEVMLALITLIAASIATFYVIYQVSVHLVIELCRRDTEVHSLKTKLSELNVRPLNAQIKAS